MAGTPGLDDLSGLVGVAARVIDALGEWGVGLLVVAETIIPPIPSEIVLPLAGFISRQGSMNVWLVITTATLGSLLGALFLYWLGRVLGHDRAIRLLAKLPLVDARDFERASDWFGRHGRPAVFFGRLIPGVRSLISIPAGSERMPVVTFVLLTAAGSAAWNGALVGLGYALGSQYELVDQYSAVLDGVVLGVLAVILGWLVIRRIRRGRPPGQRDDGSSPPPATFPPAPREETTAE